MDAVAARSWDREILAVMSKETQMTLVMRNAQMLRNEIKVIVHLPLKIPGLGGLHVPLRCHGMAFISSWNNGSSECRQLF
jgi:hypothetical protein